MIISAWCPYTGGVNGGTDVKGSTGEEGSGGRRGRRV